MPTNLLTRRHWGRWSLDTKPPASLTIMLTDFYPYEITLRRCRTEYQRRQWLQHMATKRAELVNKRDIADLAGAFEDLIEAGVIKNDTN